MLKWKEIMIPATEDSYRPSEDSYSLVCEDTVKKTFRTVGCYQSSAGAETLRRLNAKQITVKQHEDSWSPKGWFAICYPVEYLRHKREELARLDERIDKLEALKLERVKLAGLVDKLQGKKLRH